MQTQTHAASVVGSLLDVEFGNRGVLSAAATGITRFIATMGGDADRVLGVCGVDPELLANPTLSMGLVNYCGVMEEAARNAHVGNFGLYYGRQFQPQSLGLIGYIGLASPTVEQALFNFAGDFHFHQHDTLTRVADAGDCWRLDYQVRHGAILNRRQDAELTMGMFLNLLRRGLGEHWAPREVHFEHPQPEQWHEHCKVFDAPVWFEQPYNSMLIPKRDLGRPMPGSDPMLLLVLREALRRLNMQPTHQNMVDKARAEIRLQLTSGEPDLDTTANKLGMSSASLRRHLRSEGCSFSALVDKLRCELATQYIRQSQLSITEMALLLGYSEASAFSRAFRRWFGTSPRQLRTNPAAPIN